MKNLVAKLLFAFVLLIPVWSFLFWFFWPTSKLDSIILDKSPNDTNHKEHRSFNWILSHEKYSNSLLREYDYSKDYMGYHPDPEGEYRLIDYDQHNEAYIDSITDYMDMAYYVEARGVLHEDWPKEMDPRDNKAVLYGGLSDKDYQVLERLYQKRKLIIAEYNTIGKPTPAGVRSKMEELFEVDYTGWTGCYFSSLDTAINPDIPVWARRAYTNYNGKAFAFDNISGIILIHQEGKVMVLENKKHLELDIPVINTPIEYQRKLGLPDFVKYPYWFDITLSRKPENAVSYYKIHTNESGDSILEQNGLSNKFPAIIGDHTESLRYYFCGDFADNPVQDLLAYFKGVELISKLFYNDSDPNDRRKFFWKFYYPLMESIIDNYKDRLAVNQKERMLPAYAADSMDEGARIYETEEILDTPITSVEEDIIEPEPEIKTTPEEVEQENTPIIINKRYLVGGNMPKRRWQAIGRALKSSTDLKTESFSAPGVPGQITHTNENSGQEKWYIVIASLKSTDKAERYVRSLGYPELELIFVPYLNTNRISYGSYNSLRDAQLKFQEIVNKHPDAWMVKF